MLPLKYMDVLVELRFLLHMLDRRLPKPISCHTNVLHDRAMDQNSVMEVGVKADAGVLHLELTLLEH